MSDKKYTVDEVLLTYASWQAMKKRCNGKSKNKNDQSYIEKGISVSPIWLNDFSKFIDDLGPRSAVEYTLDRYPNKDGNYEPGNVRWANKTEQAVNRKTTRMIEYLGEVKPISYWAETSGISSSTISRRLAAGWDVKQALSEPPEVKPIVGFVDGQTKGKKLNIQQVGEIKEKALSGDYNLTELGREYKVAPTSILNILKKFHIVIQKKHTKKIVTNG